MSSLDRILVHKTASPKVDVVASKRTRGPCGPSRVGEHRVHQGSVSGANAGEQVCTAGLCAWSDGEREYEDILYEVRNGVAWITINRPEKMNSFRGQTCDETGIQAVN